MKMKKNLNRTLIKVFHLRDRVIKIKVILKWIHLFLRKILHFLLHTIKFIYKEAIEIEKNKGQ
jgi:hypothetical protein